MFNARRILKLFKKSPALTIYLACDIIKVQNFSGWDFMKKTLSIIFLCTAIVAFILTVALAIDTNFSMLELNNTEPDIENLLGEIMVAIAIWFAFLIIAFLLSAVGLFSSMLCKRFSESAAIQRISAVTMYIHATTATISLVCIILFAFKTI